MTSGPLRPVVLFLCVHNSGRSLAAKVLLEHYAQGRVEVFSAGSEPASQLNSSVVAVLKERGFDPSKEFPKALTDVEAEKADVVVTMGCGDACPFYPGKTYLDWELTDPAGQPLEVVRPIVDEIDRRVRALLAHLGSGGGCYGRRVLSDAAFVGFIPVRNPVAARAFYAGTLGLPVVEDTPFALVVDAGGTLLRVTPVPDLVAQPFTIAGWKVRDIDATVRTLSDSGVRFERYDGMAQDELGVWTSPSGDRVAWFKDPDGNTLSVTGVDDP